MKNISWGKTVSNWGLNDQNFNSDSKIATIREKKQRISTEEIIKKLDVIHQSYLDLLKLSNELYPVFSSKDLSDSIISLESALNALESITIVQEPVKQETEETVAMESYERSVWISDECPTFTSDKDFLSKKIPELG